MSPDHHVTTARAFYDALVERYVEFVGTEVGPATEAPVDRSLLDAFAEMLAEGPDGPVADLGCGPARVAARLARRGFELIGIDLSPAMLAAARGAHPGIGLAAGRLDELPLRPGSLAGAACWYSIIYTPPQGLDRTLAELGRVLMTAGHLLLAFQAGDGEAAHRTDAHGTGLPLTSYRHGLDGLSQRLDGAGFDVRATARRQAELPHESTPQAFVIARRR